jgi:leucyl/phenylalanyl-tRNA--protein transferase
MNPHLARFGAYHISSEEYAVLLKEAVSSSCNLI